MEMEVCTRRIGRNAVELEREQQVWRVSRREICRKGKHGKYDDRVHRPLKHPDRKKANI